MKIKDNVIEKRSFENILAKTIQKVIILYIIFTLYKAYNAKINYFQRTSPKKKKLLNKKLYWKEQTSLNIDKILEEIKNFIPTISFENKADFKRKKNPKISLVLTLYNQSNHINFVYSSIQKQVLKDIEIIFVDDDSRDNTSKVIKKLIDKDKRIVYLKNKINKGAYYSRKKGILNARGEYILCIDPDDMLVNNILIKAYETAKKYELDIVHFYALKGYYESPKLWTDLKNKDGILKNNKEIKDNFYKCTSRNLWDKLVKADVFKASTKFMNKEFSNKIYFINNDNTAFFGLLHTAKTYGFLEQIGYFYITRPKGDYYYRSDPRNMNIIFRSIFNNMRYFYLQSDNNTIEKNYMAFEYFNKSMRLFGKFIPNVTIGLDYILNVFDLYMSSSYFNDIHRKRLKYFKSKFVERKKRLNNINENDNFKIIYSLLNM